MGYGEHDFEFVNFKPFKHGDVLARAPLYGDPKRDQDASFVFGIAFSEDGPGAGAPHVVQTLEWIGDHIESGVIKPLLPFL